MLSCFSHVQLIMDCRPPGCSVHGDSPGKNTGAGRPNRGIEAESLTSLALAGKFCTTSATWEAHKATGFFKKHESKP